MAFVLLVSLLCGVSALRPPDRLPLGRQKVISHAVGRSASNMAAAAPGDGELLANSTAASGSGVGASMINLVKAIVGAGVLSLPVGVAAFSSSRGAVLPSVVTLGVITMLSAYCFAMVARVCEFTNSQTWAEAWTRTIGEATAWVPSSFVALLCFSMSLQYTMVLGDSFSSIFTAAGLPRLISSRRGAIALVTVFTTLPLSLLPNLDMLKYTSFLGIGGLLYTAAFMLARVGAYAPGTVLHAAAAIPPSFSTAPFVLSSMLQPKVFVLVSILATAFCAHFLAPQFFSQLSAEIDGSSKMPRFNLLSAGGFGLSAVLSAVFQAAGFLTFGGACDGYILNNYANSDRLAQAARVAIGCSIISSYPLLHQGLRDTLTEALGTPRVVTTFGCVGVISLLGMKLTNLGAVATVSGALVSTSLVYVLPTLMFAQMLKAQRSAGDKSLRLRLELLGSRLITVLGFFLVTIGVKAAC